jgi:hypothetical protein
MHPSIYDDDDDDDDDSSHQCRPLPRSECLVCMLESHLLCAIEAWVLAASIVPLDFLFRLILPYCEQLPI